MMKSNGKHAVLFDFDGVVMDTERQYSHFWKEIGVRYGFEALERRVKGQTLTYIYDHFFCGMEQEQRRITEELLRYEQQMTYEYVPGVVQFIDALRRADIPTAVVTSSNRQKMASVYRVHPEVKQLFGHILTAECFAASKPDPDCYLRGMDLFHVLPEATFVFEDSPNGLRAARASGACVIGLATTQPAEEIAPLCHRVIPDFTDFTVETMFDTKRNEQ